MNLFSYVCLIVRDKDLYSVIFLILNDFLINVEQAFFKFGVQSMSAKVFYFILSDISMFSEKKTNLGLFHLRTKLNIHLFCSGVDFISTRILLKNLKIKFF